MSYFKKIRYFSFNKHNLRVCRFRRQVRRGFSVCSMELLFFKRRHWSSMHLVFKRFLRKPEKMGKKLWLTPTYTFNLTKKSKGSRMGKGRGKKLIPSLILLPGSAIIQFTNVRILVARRLVAFLQRRWGVYLCLFTNATLLNTLKHNPSSDKILYWVR